MEARWEREQDPWLVNRPSRGLASWTTCPHSHNASARWLSPGGTFCQLSKGMIFRQGLDSTQDGGRAIHVAIVRAEVGLGDCHKQAPYGPLKTFRVFSLAPVTPTLTRNELPSLKIQEIFT